MRTSSDEGWDGPRNLLDAAAAAASDQSAGRGTMVVFHGKVFAGMTAVKTHANDPDAFAAPHSAPIGRVEKGCVVYEDGKRENRKAGRGRSIALRALSAKVALVPMVVGDDGSMLDAARSGHDGLVIIAFGSGNLPPGAVPAISRWIQEGKAVVLASRCHAGVVTPLYAFEGGGARLAAMGVTPAGLRTPSQAWMELMISLSAGTEYGN
jgi:L-asparaginase